MTRPRRSDEIARQIMDLIVERGLGPGEPLPTEPELMSTIGVSRNSVRESVKALQALGIVETRHGYGTFVGSGSSDALQTWLLFRTRRAGTTDTARLRDLLEVREIIETELTRRVAGEHAAELLDELGERVRRMAADDPAGDAEQADREFHDLICRAAGYDLARELIGLFWSVYRTAEAEVGRPVSTAEATAERHQVIVDALAGGDPDEAAEAVHRHFDEVRRRVNLDRYGGLAPRPSA